MPPPSHSLSQPGYTWRPLLEQLRPKVVSQRVKHESIIHSYILFPAAVERVTGPARNFYIGKKNVP